MLGLDGEHFGVGVCVLQRVYKFLQICFHCNQGLSLNMPDFHLISLQIPVKIMTQSSLGVMTVYTLFYSVVFLTINLFSGSANAQTRIPCPGSFANFFLAKNGYDNEPLQSPWPENVEQIFHVNVLLKVEGQQWEVTWIEGALASVSAHILPHTSAKHQTMQFSSSQTQKHTHTSITFPSLQHLSCYTTQMCAIEEQTFLAHIHECKHFQYTLQYMHFCKEMLDTEQTQETHNKYVVHNNIVIF